MVSQTKTLRFFFCLFVGTASITLNAPLFAQNFRSAWMWKAPTHPYGTANVIGDLAKEAEMISYFGAWGFDRIYASLGDTPLTDPTSIARWNAALDDVGMDSQKLHGIVIPNPTSLANLVQTQLIDFNVSRADPRERFDAVHLDIEPHASAAWQGGTPAERRDLLFDLRDTYVAARSQLDNNGAGEVKIYADLPVWYDSSSSIGWLDTADRDQWFADIGVPLDGITLMAFERDTLSSITSGVGWEVANFNGEVRVGLNANEVGPGDTFADFDAMLAMADAIELFYGSAIGGIDFQPLATFTDLAPTPVLTADFDEDSDIDGADFLAWQRGYGISSGATLAQGDANGNGSVNVSDLLVWQQQLSAPAIAGAAAVPEPNSWALVIVGLVCLLSRSKHHQNATKIPLAS
ncbi:MAG: hypothetical protein GXP26_14920 [Planctomycetes bacterium]|nr:hypothetical protein [Planctomycetota bacterium]